MSDQPPPRDRATVAQLLEFDAVIDVRTPSEFALDHIPGASSLPVLSDEERARVGTLHKQMSPFAARKVGAALISASIARHLESALRDRPRAWRPLVYCWRGGKRSAALTHVLREIGWDAQQLDGGYKAFRRAVMADLPALAPRLGYRVVCGFTGSGKSRLLQALRAAGAQVLDLEALAAHRGSVLGNLPGAPQPTQKMFESLLWDRLRRFDRQRPVFVESESKKIGLLQVPQTLLDCMWAGDCVQLSTPRPLRVELLMQEYAHFLSDPDLLGKQLDCLVPLHGHAVIERWKAFAAAGEWEALVDELLVRHYDPAYSRSIVSHYPRLPQARVVQLEGGGEAAFSRAASRLLDEAPEAVT
ncbi:MAG TPA: tRNA 2-selenouridine(34) synthase MnmH [Burkholderiales bacterium]|nr:tRNA 2-selenouridine(34) synthase MnmH [Burkholderiales bacterium]